MNVVVLSASGHKNCTLNDVAGGFGNVFTVGNSPFARLLEIAKRRIAAIPSITLAYLDSILSANGANVKILEVRSADQLVPADLYLISSSIVDCTFERELGLAAKSALAPRSAILAVSSADALIRLIASGRRYMLFTPCSALYRASFDMPLASRS